MMKDMVKKAFAVATSAAVTATMALPALAQEEEGLAIAEGNQIYQIVALLVGLAAIWIAYKGLNKAKSAVHGALSMIIVAAIALGANQVFKLTNIGMLVGDANWSDIFAIIALGALTLGAMQLSESSK